MNTKLLEFTAYFKPTSLKRPRLVKSSIVYDPSKKDKQNWVKTVQQYIPQQPFSCPLIIELEFYFKRPKNHYRTGKYCDLLKSKAPMIHCFMPDIDNLAKFILDAMNEKFFLDDRQVVKLIATKHYINDLTKQKTTPGYTNVKLYQYTTTNCVEQINQQCNQENHSL
tara:strand:+ start:126 stop:626 length:501 start_codon:yes stop_codon:yes gene_type:complete